MRGLLVAAALGLALLFAAPALAAQSYPLNFHTFDLTATGGGSTDGLTYSGGALRLDSGSHQTFSYTDPYAYFNNDGVNGSGTYEYGTWTSPVYPVGFAFNELVSSWNAVTPAGTWIQSEVRVLLNDGNWSDKWYILGRWSSGDSDFHRTSVGGQGDADGYVAIDTFFAKDHPAVAYQLRLTLFRLQGSSNTPTVSRYSAVVSNLTNQKPQFPSATTMNGQAIDLANFGPNAPAFPSYSQELHHGEYPQFDGGGEAWCSPTSTAMVVAHWGFSPNPSLYAYVSSDYPNVVDPVVDYTARMVFDYHYHGAGNWPFNTAYAASQGLVADVTQLHNLTEAEAFIKAHVPLVASVAWNSNKLDTAIKSTNGHLLVIGGFTGTGDVIAYDPASTDDAHVRHIYNREQFERAWIPASGGIVYVDRPSGSINDSMLTANNWPTP